MKRRMLDYTLLLLESEKFNWGLKLFWFLEYWFTYRLFFEVYYKVWGKLVIRRLYRKSFELLRGG